MKQDEISFLIIAIFVALFFLVQYADEPAKEIYKQKFRSLIGLNMVEKKPKEKCKYYETGKASWCGRQHRGKKMANGQKYDPNAISFAHRNIPINSTIKVTNLDNGEVVIGNLTDRGPYIKSRILDVSEKAAKTLGFKKNGLARVKIEVLKQRS